MAGGRCDPGEGGRHLRASILDAKRREIFKLKVDASTGGVLGEGQKPATQPTSTALSGEDIKQSLKALFGELSVGQALRKGEQPFYEVPLTYRGQEVARIKVNPVAHQVMPTGGGLKGGQGEKEGTKGQPEKSEKGKMVPKNLVVPLGWGSALIMIVSSLYYSWKRSLYTPLRLSSGEAKATAVAGLRRTLWWHMVLGIVAIGIVIVHVLNFTAKIQLSVSWLALGMAIVVAASGAFGKFLAKSEAVRRHWRRFHVPYTILFFMVLFIHILEKTKVLGD